MLYLVSSDSGLIKKMYVNNSFTDNLACALPGRDAACLSLNYYLPPFINHSYFLDSPFHSELIKTKAVDEIKK